LVKFASKDTKSDNGLSLNVWPHFNGGGSFASLGPAFINLPPDLIFSINCTRVRVVNGGRGKNKIHPS